MASKQVKLSIPEQIFTKLQKEKQENAYSSIQEVIINKLRRDYFVREKGKDNRGRPRSLDEEKILTRKHLFK